MTQWLGSVERTINIRFKIWKPPNYIPIPSNTTHTTILAIPEFKIQRDLHRTRPSPSFIPYPLPAMTRKVDEGTDTPSDRDTVWSSLLPPKSPTDTVVIIQMDSTAAIDTETASTPVTPTTTPVASVDTPRLSNNRKNTLLSTFHRNLRMSIKAVADSPGHLSR